MASTIIPVIKHLKIHNPHWKKQHHTPNQTQRQLIQLTLHLTKLIRAPYTQPQTGSAYRPRHLNNNAYHLINNRKHNSITSPKYIKNNKEKHFSPKQIENIIPAIPNLFTTTKYTTIVYLKTNMINPKTLHSYGYYFINILELLKCGDIEPNPGPMPNILHTHPATHKKRANIYFTPNNIKLQPEYQHIANTFGPIN